MSGSLPGLISLGPQSDPEAQARRAELVPAGAGAVWSAAIAEGFDESPGPRLARIIGRGYTDVGDGNYEALNATDELGLPTGQLPPSPMVPLDVLQREYTIPGVLSFSKDTPQSVAQSLYEHKLAQMKRQDVMRRADNMLTSGMAVRFIGSMIGSIADPVNLAAMFVPGVQEAMVARMAGIGAGAGALARAGVRAGAGASQGATGMLALEPLNYLLTQQERDDWTMQGALLNVLIGTVAGAGLHSTIGALRERSVGLPEWAPARTFERRILAQTPEVQEVLMRDAVAAQVEGRPVVSSELLDLHTALEREAAALRGEAASVSLTGLDPVTEARIETVRAEMETEGLTAARRAELDAELTMLTEGNNRDAIALEQARSEAQRQGLEIAAGRTERALADVERQLEEATRPTPREIVERMQAARTPVPEGATPPRPISRTGDPPPEPEASREPTATAKDIAAVEKETAAMDQQIKVLEDERTNERLAEFDKLSDEEARADAALFDAAAKCLVRSA